MNIKKGQRNRRREARELSAVQWLSTEVIRVREQVRSRRIYGGQNGIGAGFLRVLRFPLPIFIPPIAQQSSSPIVWGWYNRPVVAAVRSLNPLRIIKIFRILLLLYKNQRKNKRTPPPSSESLLPPRIACLSLSHAKVSRYWKVEDPKMKYSLHLWLFH
jgi:hypothetical protein